MKKLLLAFVFATGILGCLCDDVNPFWRINDFQLEFLNDDSEWSTTDSVTIDSLNFIVDFDFDFVAENTLPNFFIPTAAATTCPDPGEDGIKDAITAMTLTSNEDYNGTPAGESLDAIITHNGVQGFQDFVDNISIYPAVDFIGFIVHEKPMGVDSFKLNLQIDFASGNSMSKETGFIFWQ